MQAPQTIIHPSLWICAYLLHLLTSQATVHPQWTAELTTYSPGGIPVHSFSFRSSSLWCKIKLLDFSFTLRKQGLLLTRLGSWKYHQLSLSPIPLSALKAAIGFLSHLLKLLFSRSPLTYILPNPGCLYRMACQSVVQTVPRDPSLVWINLVGFYLLVCWSSFLVTGFHVAQDVIKLDM